MARRSLPQPQFVSKRVMTRFAVMLVLLGLLALAAGLLVGFVRMAWQEHQINRAIERQSAENAEQRARNLRLLGEAEWSESDVAAEQAARERLGMARDGETVLLPTVVLPSAPTAVPSPVAQASQAPVGSMAQESNARRWVRALFPGPDVLP